MNCAKKVEEKKHHFFIEISDIGLSSKEEKEIEHLKKKIEENIEKMNQLKHIIEYYLKHIKIVKGNTDIYEKNQKIII